MKQEAKAKGKVSGGHGRGVEGRGVTGEDRGIAAGAGSRKSHGKATLSNCSQVDCCRGLGDGNWDGGGRSEGRKEGVSYALITQFLPVGMKSSYRALVLEIAIRVSTIGQSDLAWVDG